MKKLILIAGLILISHLSFPQIKPESSFWSIGFSGGLPLKLLDKVNSRYDSHAGYVWGVNLYINIDRNTAIGTEFNFGRFTSQKTEYLYYSVNNYHKFFEITFGPKFHLGNNYFAIVQLGNYFMVYNREYENVHDEFLIYNLESDSYPGFGASLGLEKKIPINKHIDLNLSGKLSLGLPGMEPVFYGLLRAGITFNEETRPAETEMQLDKTHSVSLLGGFISPVAASHLDYNLTPVITLEGSVKTSRNIEMFGSITYNKIHDNYSKGSSSYSSITEITAGPRFFIGSQNYAGFLQPGGGVYYYYRRTQDYTEDDMFYGVNAGTGAKIKVYKDLSVLLIGKWHVILNEHARPGEYFSASCGIRYEI